jgi:EAL domain-containing protein (putative c-di-GMP-specific phosphodiesterase class I)
MSGWKKLSDRSVEIVAEYVENEDIQAKIMEYNIDYSQGYLFSEPSPDIDGM